MCGVVFNPSAPEQVCGDYCKGKGYTYFGTEYSTGECHRVRVAYRSEVRVHVALCMVYSAMCVSISMVTLGGIIFS